VFVYAPDGRELGRIDVPERPLQLVFGGPGKQTLFVLTHHALYAVRGPKNARSGPAKSRSGRRPAGPDVRPWS
jgi:sugar lactone lactonase YvrE